MASSVDQSGADVSNHVRSSWPRRLAAALSGGMTIPGLLITYALVDGLFFQEPVGDRLQMLREDSLNFIRVFGIFFLMAAWQLRPRKLVVSKGITRGWSMMRCTSWVASRLSLSTAIYSICELLDYLLNIDRAQTEVADQNDYMISNALGLVPTAASLWTSAVVAVVLTVGLWYAHRAVDRRSDRSATEAEVTVQEPLLGQIVAYVTALIVSPMIISAVLFVLYIYAMRMQR